MSWLKWEAAWRLHFADRIGLGEVLGVGFGLGIKVIFGLPRVVGSAQRPTPSVAKFHARPVAVTPRWGGGFSENDSSNTAAAKSVGLGKGRGSRYEL